MPDIRHRIGVVASAAVVHHALTTVDGLAGWWTTDTSADGVNSLRFRFGGGDGFDMSVVDSQPGSRVAWEVTAGPDEWLGTSLAFDLEERHPWTIVRFTHAGWRSSSDFYADCTTQWAMFLISLKNFIETGTGQPWPHEVKISEQH